MARHRHLWDSAQRALSDGAPALSRVLLLNARPHLPDRAAQHVCPACFGLLVPGLTCTTRERRQPKARRPAVRRRALPRCHQCGHQTSTPAAVRPSARADAAAAPEDAPKKQAKRARQQQQQQQHQQQQEKQKQQQKKARKGSQAPASALPPPGDDSLFGFDFVPL